MNLLKFPDNSRLSNTDDARLSRLEAGFPASVRGRVTFSNSALAVPATANVTPSGTIAPTGITATGSTFAFTVQGNFAYTSSGSSITIYWDGTNGSKLLAIRRADGSNYSILADSMTVDGLTGGVEYAFYPYIALAQPAMLSFVAGDSGSPMFAFAPGAAESIVTAALRTQRSTVNESITVGPIKFTGGGSGPGNGTYTGQSV